MIICPLCDPDLLEPLIKIVLDSELPFGKM